MVLLQTAQFYGQLFPVYLRTFFLFSLDQQKLFRFKEKFSQYILNALKLLLHIFIRLFYLFKLSTWEICFELC